MQTLICNGISFWPPDFSVRPIHILVEGDTISRVSEDPIRVESEMEVYDIDGKLIVPGFISSHNHLTQSFGRGNFDNLNLTQWMERFYHNFHMTAEEVYMATLIGCIESIKSGTTTVAEMVNMTLHRDIAIQAIADSGLRAVVCSCIRDYQEGNGPPPDLSTVKALEMMREMYQRWNNKCEGRITTRVSPVGLPACTEELMRGSRVLADELGIGIHTHCCEGHTESNAAFDRFGCSEVEALYRFGVLGPDAQLVHCVWLTEHDKQLIAETGSSVVYCASTNTKVADGVPPMSDLFKLGVNIAIGCDGEASSGTYDILQEARLASLLAKGTCLDASVFSADQMFYMMTRNGAKAVGLDGQVGSLQTGRKADLTVIDYPRIHLIDESRLLSNLIYSATAGDVESVFVGGCPLMWNGELKFLDEEKITADALNMMRKADYS